MTCNISANLDVADLGTESSPCRDRALAAQAFQPKILYPYHFGDTDTAKVVELLQGETGIEVRIRKMS